MRDPGGQCIYYGETGYGPHQPDRTAGTGMNDPTFRHEADGNMTGAAGRTFGYIPFNVASVSRGDDVAGARLLGDASAPAGRAPQPRYR